MTNWVLIAITVSFTLMLSLNTHTYAWHENLGIDNNKAAELYQTKPNDPAIMQWKNALQSAFNDMDKCFCVYLDTNSCPSLFNTITSNCESHPNTLLACSDSRLAHFPIILEKALAAEKKAEEERKKAEKVLEEEAKRSRPIRIQQYGADMLNKCFLNNMNASSKFEVASSACDLEMSSLQSECQLANNTLNYCKDERFVGYLKQHNVLNSTVLN